jgi:hypothetical protein
LFLTVSICSWYLVLYVCPVCLIYFNVQSMHLICCTPLFSYSSRRRGFTKFCMVFLVQNAILMFVFFEKFCDFFCFFSIIRECSPFCCLMLLACIFVVFLITWMIYV